MAPAAKSQDLNNSTATTTPTTSITLPQETTTTTNGQPIRIESFSSFPVNQVQTFEIILSKQFNQTDLIVDITNPVLGTIDKRCEWVQPQQQQSQQQQQLLQHYNKCQVSFKALIVDVYTICVELADHPSFSAQFQAKAYDLSKVLIKNSSGKCYVNECYEFQVDASEAGQGQLEIAVNEGEIPNQVQVLDNGRCVVNFVPEEPINHVVDIKFNGHNVNGCPFSVEVRRPGEQFSSSTANNSSSITDPNEQPKLVKDEHILVNTASSISLRNISSIDVVNKTDLVIIDPEGRCVDYESAKNDCNYEFAFKPTIVGDYTVELKSELAQKLPAQICGKFPLLLKVFDHSKVIVSDVTNGVVGSPIFFFIDASQAGSGNLEIRVSSKTKNVPNHPQAEANAKIRVSFVPTEPVEHTIDVKFNGISVPGNPFVVKVASVPQAILPEASKKILKYVAIDELVQFNIDYIGSKENGNALASDLVPGDCKGFVLGPDFHCTKLESIEMLKVDGKVSFKVAFRLARVGPHKLFVFVKNEILSDNPIPCNVYNINEVLVTFEDSKQSQKTDSTKPVGNLDKPFTFGVDASRAGEGTLALAVVANGSGNPVQTKINVSEKGLGLYNLTFVPNEHALHSIDMSFNDRPVPKSPFIIDILDNDGCSSITPNIKDQAMTSNNDHQQMVQNFGSLSLKQSNKMPKDAVTTISGKKSLAYGLVSATNVVYLESGVLENEDLQIELVGPSSENVPFRLAKAKGAPSAREQKKPYIEYKPEAIGTHMINVLENSRIVRQYQVEICNPTLAKIVDFNPNQVYAIGKQIVLSVDSSNAGQIQIDSVSITGPKPASSKNKDGEYTLLSRIKSMSSNNSHSHSQSIDYAVSKISETRHEIRFVPSIVGKYTVDIRCLGQAIHSTPLVVEVKNQAKDSNHHNQGATNNCSHQSQQSTQQQQRPSSEDEIIKNIVVHGISLKCAPVNSTGAFIIETNRLAQARDFDVLISDPQNSLVDVRCYLREDANLLAEWTPTRVGTHKIEVLYKGKHVPESPFKSEAFDPSQVIIDKIDSFVCGIDEKIAFKLSRKDAGYGELDVTIISPLGKDLPIDVKSLSDDDDLGELITFTPQVAGKYKISITFGGFEIPKSPITFTAINPKSRIKVSGNGLKVAEVGRSAHFVVETASEEQELKVEIECCGKEIVPKVETRANTHIVKYKPAEVGYARISLFLNGSPGDQSPYSVPVYDYSKFVFLGGTSLRQLAPTNNNQLSINYEPKVPREFAIDASKCGPGELQAEAYCRANPNLKFKLPVIKFSSGKYKLTFTCPPQPNHDLANGFSQKDFSVKATYLIRFYLDNLLVPETLASVIVEPLVSSSSKQHREDQPKMHLSDFENNNAKPTLNREHLEQAMNSRDSRIECPIVALRGHGLADARCGDEAEFTIDGSKAGPGKPEVRINTAETSIDVKISRIEGKLYKATYVPKQSGIYSLNVLWDGKQVAGCPISINVLPTCDANKVICTGDGLKGGILGEEIKTFIDTRRAGPGELTALCSGPQKVAFCELLDRGDGTFILYIKPQESGKHYLTIKYGDVHIPKSPFAIKISGKPDPSKVRVHGPGVEHGVLSLYQSKFVCDTRGAGAGQLTVRIRGPKGAFRMETQREGQRERTILCKYDPTEPGDYRIEIKWSGRHVPGSPFTVMIFDTQEELNRFLSLESRYMTTNNKSSRNNPALHQPQHHPHPNHHHPQVPYPPNMLDYAHYSNMPSSAHQPPFKL